MLYFLTQISLQKSLNQIFIILPKWKKWIVEEISKLSTEKFGGKNHCKISNLHNIGPK